MKKILVFLLVAALILSMGTTVFAVKGGDTEQQGMVAFGFNSESYIDSLNYVARNNADNPNVKLVPSSDITLSYDYSAKLVIDGTYGTKFFFDDTAAAAFNNMSLEYVNINIYNAQSANKTLLFNVGYNTKGSATLSSGWNLVTLPVENCFSGNTRTTKQSYAEANTNAGSFNIVGYPNSSTNPVDGDIFYIDKIWLSKDDPESYTYDVSQDSAKLWEFNSDEAFSSLSFSTAANNPKLTKDRTNVNSYEISAKLTTNGLRRMQIIFTDNTMNLTNQDGTYVYDYINFLVGNPSNEAITMGCGIPSGIATAIATLQPGWNVVSYPISSLFRPEASGTSTYKRGYYTDLTGNSLQICDDKGGNGTNAISGIVYNFDMIWVSKTPAAVGTADANGTIVSQTPLTCTDAAINSDGTASCKITSWPGERFVVIFATYNSDGSLNSVDCVKDYDGGENKETVVNSSKALTIPEGGTTKVMVWNGFGEIAPMTTVK